MFADSVPDTNILHRQTLKALGPGLLESAYEECLCQELNLQNIPYKRQVDLPIEYKGMTLSAGYRMDIVIDGLVVVELKAVERTLPIHDAQLITYLRLSKIRLGLLINFNVSVLKQGITRRVHGY